MDDGVLRTGDLRTAGEPLPVDDGGDAPAGRPGTSGPGSFRWGRGAFYSYNRNEDLLGMVLRNADQLHPEWRNLEVGDTMWMSHPRLKYLVPETGAAIIDEPTTLVFASGRQPQA